MRIWVWIERVLFGVGLAALLHPVLSSWFFHTVDGPSHLYNAGALGDLLFGDADALPWELNPIPVPNWTGHALMAVLLTFLDPLGALKVVHVLCLACLPLAMRLLASTRSGIPWTTHLILPFTLNAVFMLGYFNFALALPMVLLVMWYWAKAERGTHGPWACLVLALLLVLLYFTHLLPFLFALAWLVWQLIAARLFRKASVDSTRTPAWMNGPLPWLAMVPSLLLYVWFLVATHEGGWADADVSDRWAHWMRPFLMSDRAMERWAYAGACICIALALFAGRRWSDLLAGLRRRVVSVIFLVAMLGLFLVAPDQLGRGSDVLIRLSILLHVLVIALLPTWRRSPWGGVVLSLASIGVVLMQMDLRDDDRRFQEERSRACTEMARMVPSGSSVVVYPVNWWDAHLPKIGLAGRDITLLSNYEMMNPHFPLRWRPDEWSRMTSLGPDTLDAVTPETLVPGKLMREADHILIIGMPGAGAGLERLEWMLQELSASHATMARNDVCWILAAIEPRADQGR